MDKTQKMNGENNIDPHLLQMTWAFAHASEFGSRPGGNHVIRVGCFAFCVARQLIQDEDFATNLLIAAPLHDVGYIGIPREIIQKQGSLALAELETMRHHCRIGYEILTQRHQTNAISLLGLANDSLISTKMDPYLEMAATIALNHHEKFNGSGYPYSRKGDEIPIEARITSICDVFDSLTSKRPFREAYTCELALDLIEGQARSDFDPEVLAAFREVYPEILAIREQLPDTISVSTTTDDIASGEFIITLV